MGLPGSEVEIKIMLPVSRSRVVRFRGLCCWFHLGYSLRENQNIEKDEYNKTNTNSTGEHLYFPFIHALQVVFAKPIPDIYV